MARAGGSLTRRAAPRYFLRPLFQGRVSTTAYGFRWHSCETGGEVAPPPLPVLQVLCKAVATVGRRLRRLVCETTAVCAERKYILYTFYLVKKCKVIRVPSGRWAKAESETSGVPGLGPEREGMRYARP